MSSRFLTTLQMPRGNSRNGLAECHALFAADTCVAIQCIFALKQHPHAEQFPAPVIQGDRQQIYSRRAELAEQRLKISRLVEP